MMRGRLILLVLLAGLAAGGWAANNRVLFLLAEGFNNGEFWGPYAALCAAGYQVEIAGIQRGVVPLSPGKVNAERDSHADLSLDDVDPSRYVGLVIPGGYSPGNLEKYPKTLEICRQFMQANKPVAGICHGPRLLLRADLLRGRVFTCLNTVKNELADEWISDKRGKYLDEPVVIDGNLLTSRYPNDVLPFSTALLTHLAQFGGLPVTGKQASILVVYPGGSPHQKWLLSNLEALGIKAKVLTEGDVSNFVKGQGYDPASYDLLTVLNGAGLEKLRDNADFRALVQDMQAKQRPVQAAGDAQGVLKALGLDTGVQPMAQADLPGMLREVATAALAAGQPAPKPEEPAYDTVVRLQQGFHDQFYALTKSVAKLAGGHVLFAGERAGWVFGKDGLPAHVSSTFADVKGLVLPQAMITGTTMEAVLPDGQTQTLDDLRKTFTTRPFDADKIYTAAIALRPGFDDEVYATLWAWLDGEDGDVLVIGPKTGELRGLNGTRATVMATYADAVKLAPDATIIAPGGLWPEKAEARQAQQPAWIEHQEKADRQRMDWLLARYKAGAMLVAFGFDALRLGGYEAFQGKKFASSDQTVWSFPKTGASYANDSVLLSADHLITAKGAGSIPEALKLLGEQRE